MSQAEAGAEGPRGPSGDDQSAVYLLEVDSIDDLHNVPLDADQPPGAQDPAPDKEVPSGADLDPAPSGNCCGICSIVAIVALVLLAAVANFALLLYVVYTQKHQDRMLQDVAHRLDVQTQVLRQMASTHGFLGGDPGEM